MDKSREQALEDGANMNTGGVNFDYVDTAKLERMGLLKYNTKKPNGDNFIRIVAPSLTGPFAQEIWMHTKVGTQKATFLCVNKMFGEPCAICDHQKDMKADGVSAEVIKELNPGHRFLMYVVDTTNADTEDEGPKWFDCPVSIYKNVCTLSKDRRTGQSFDPTDPVDGRDVEFVRKDGKRTEYTGMRLVPTKPIPKNWYEDLPAFEEVLLIPTYDEAREAVSGQRASKEESTRGSSRGEDRGSRRDVDDRGSRRDVDDDRGSRRETRDVPEDEVDDNVRGSRRETSRREQPDRERSRGREDSSRDTGQEESVRAKLDEIQNRKRSRE